MFSEYLLWDLTFLFPLYLLSPSLFLSPLSPLPLEDDLCRLFDDGIWLLLWFISNSRFFVSFLANLSLCYYLLSMTIVMKSRCEILLIETMLLALVIGSMRRKEFSRGRSTLRNFIPWLYLQDNIMFECHQVKVGGI